VLGVVGSYLGEVKGQEPVVGADWDDCGVGPDPTEPLHHWQQALKASAVWRPDPFRIYHEGNSAQRLIDTRRPDHTNVLVLSSPRLSLVSRREGQVPTKTELLSVCFSFGRKIFRTVKLRETLPTKSHMSRNFREEIQTTDLGYGDNKEGLERLK
jgi:hypothetical protein